MGNKYSKLVYEYRKKLGKCTNCGKNDAVKGRSQCRRCLDYKKKSQKKKMESETEKEKAIRLLKNREYRKEREKKLLENGICAYCGKNPICLFSKRYCSNCLEKNNNRKEKSKSGKT